VKQNHLHLSGWLLLTSPASPCWLCALPPSRYGSCELMLGCMAKAKSYEILVNTNEVGAQQWQQCCCMMSLTGGNMPPVPLVSSDGACSLGTP
jgi:hypothetical protein